MDFKPLKDLLAGTNGIFREKEPLAPYTSLKIGGRALFYAKPSSWNSLPSLLRELHRQSLPFRVLGRGTNLLISDADLPFGVIHILRMDGKVNIEDCTVEADADVLLGECCKESFEYSLTGLETLEMIPGSVGGAAVMNAGAHGRSIFNFIREVIVLDPEGNEKQLYPADIEIGYRRTNLRDFGLVRKARIFLKKGVRHDIDIKAKEFLRKRNESQPWNARTAGSVFKNPEGSFAGKILEEIGFRGKVRGDASFSGMHANFLINAGKATFQDAYGLAEEARAKALERGFNLDYEMEVWK